jgi:hypothetical protein
MEGEQAKWWWYLLAFVFGPIGGIVGFLVWRNKNRGVALNLLIVGFIALAIWWVASLLSASAFNSVSEPLFRLPNINGAPVELYIDETGTYCSGNRVTVLVRNSGASGSGQVIVSGAESTCDIPDIPSDGSGSCTLVNAVGIGNYQLTASTVGAYNASQGGSAAKATISCQ